MTAWKQIPGFEDYEVSDAGHIAWNKPTGRKMLPSNNNLTNLRWDTPRANFIDALRNGRFNHLLNES